MKQRSNYLPEFLCHSKSRCFHSSLYTNFLQRERRLPSQWEVFISLPSYSYLFPFSFHRKTGVGSFLCACILVCMCRSRCALQCSPPLKCQCSQSLPPDYPHSPPLFLRALATTPPIIPLHLPLLFLSSSAPIITPFTFLHLWTCTPWPYTHNLTP